mmetsp:Transcript_13193/g.34561  ORF Transcript_13193/g.34561 Transcript_13193/m.34561 type:complete len:103 (-) Transcript_13193:8278-8586(-)
MALLWVLEKSNGCLSLLFLLFQQTLGPLRHQGRPFLSNQARRTSMQISPFFWFASEKEKTYFSRKHKSKLSTYFKKWFGLSIFSLHQEEHQKNRHRGGGFLK